MTSKNSFSSLMKDDLKSKTWLVLMNAIIMFFNFTIVMAVQVQRVVEYLKVGNYTYKEAMNSLTYYMGGEHRYTIFITLLMACVAALSQFGYLYHKEQVDFYHSLPIRRQKRFAVRFVNGLFIYVVPYLLFCLSGLAIVSVFGYGNMEVVKAAFLGFLINSTGYLLCYATAILAVCLTGNIFTGICGMVTFFGYGYLVTGLTSVLVAICSMTYMAEYGTIGGMCNFLSPIGAYISLSRVAHLEYSGNGVLWLLGCILVSVLLILAAFWTYLNRKSESAGKSIAFEKSKGVIKGFLMTAVLVGGTVFFWSIGYSGAKIWAVIGFVITLALAHIVLQIIFELDIKAIKAGIKSSVISAVAAIIIFVGFEFGGQYYDNYEIDWEQMEYAAVGLEGAINDSFFESIYDIKSGQYIGKEEYVFECMKISDIQLVKNFTKACIESQKEMQKADAEHKEENEYTYIGIKYTMKNGKEVYRNYPVTFDVVQKYILQFMDNQEYRKGNASIFSTDIKDVTQITYSDAWADYITRYLDMNDEERQEFIETYKEEYLNATAEELIQQAPVMSFTLEAKEYNIATAVVYPSFVKTIAKLEEKGVKITKLEDVDITEMTIYWNSVDNQMDESIEITYTEPEKLQELKRVICLGDYGYYFTAFDGDGSVKGEYHISVQVEDKERGVCTQNAIFIRKVPEWLQEDLKNKQIEQEIDKVE